jgi:hypothetical protein
MRSRFAFLLLPLVAAVAFAACSNEGEGQPCDPNAGNSGNDDCQSPLVCTTGLSNADGARCCPQNRATATTPECSLSSSTFDASPAPPDTATADEASVSEAATDAPAESAVAESGAAESGVEAGVATDASDGAATDAPSAEAAGD